MEIFDFNYVKTFKYLQFNINYILRKKQRKNLRKSYKFDSFFFKLFLKNNKLLNFFNKKINQFKKRK